MLIKIKISVLTVNRFTSIKKVITHNAMNESSKCCFFDLPLANREFVFINQSEHYLVFSKKLFNENDIMCFLLIRSTFVEINKIKKRLIGILRAFLLALRTCSCVFFVMMCADHFLNNVGNHKDDLR